MRARSKANLEHLMSTQLPAHPEPTLCWHSKKRLRGTHSKHYSHEDGKEHMLNLSKPAMPRLRFPEEWHFQSPHIITALNSETPEQEAPRFHLSPWLERQLRSHAAVWKRLAEISGTLARERGMCSSFFPPVWFVALTKAVGLLPGLSL